MNLSHDLPDDWSAAIYCLGEIIRAAKGGNTNPTDNNAERFDCPAFSIHAYDWSNEAQPWNFKWRDVEVRWYKYIGRGDKVNMPVDSARLGEMLAECIPAIYDALVAA